MGIYYFEDWQHNYIPGENTLLYAPLDTDLLDHGPNSFALTNTGVSLVQNIADIPVGYFNGSAYLSGLYSSLFSFGDFHVSAWVKLTQIKNAQFIFSGISPNNVFFGYGNSNKLGIGRNGAARDSQISTALTVNTRYHISFDRIGSTLTIYVNGASIGTASNNMSYAASGGYQIGNDNTGNTITGYISDVIVENKGRTLQGELSSYYNQTKSLYGLN